MNNAVVVSKADRHKQFEKIVRTILPHLGDNASHIVLLQILTTLKLEGIIGKELSTADEKLVKSIQELVLATPEKREEALVVAQKYLT